jgi:hypothetical protein
MAGVADLKLKVELAVETIFIPHKDFALDKRSFGLDDVRKEMKEGRSMSHSEALLSLLRPGVEGQ